MMLLIFQRYHCEIFSQKYGRYVSRQRLHLATENVTVIRHAEIEPPASHHLAATEFRHFH